MTRKYTVHIVCLSFICFFFVSLTVVIVNGSVGNEFGDPFVESVAREVFPSSILFPLLMLTFGVGECVLRKSIKPLAVWAITSAASLPVLIVFDNYTVECDVSREITRQIQAKLTVQEIASLSSPESVCPTFFSYKRDSDGKWAVVSGGATFIRGTKVWFGTQ